MGILIFQECQYLCSMWRHLESTSTIISCATCLMIYLGSSLVEDAAVLDPMAMSCWRLISHNLIKLEICCSVEMRSSKWASQELTSPICGKRAQSIIYLMRFNSSLNMDGCSSPNISQIRKQDSGVILMETRATLRERVSIVSIFLKKPNPRSPFRILTLKLSLKA